VLSGPSGRDNPDVKGGKSMGISKLMTGAAVALGLMAATGAVQAADDTVKIGIVLPMTGPFASTGRQAAAGAKLFVQQTGDTVAGKKIELIIKDDAGVPDQTKRLAQELIVNDGVKFLAGFGLTPLAFAVAPLSTEAKIPTIVCCAATSAITEKSPFIARTFFTLPQAAVPLADWAAKNGIKSVVTVVADYAPGQDAEKAFVGTFEKAGGKIIESIRVPPANPDFAPFLQRVHDDKPDAVFVFVPSGVGAAFMQQFKAKGLADAGIKLIGTGDVTDDDILDSMGDVAVGTITSHQYSAAHDSQMNKDFVAAFGKANDNTRPNFMAVGAYDAMHLIYIALDKTSGDTDGEKIMAAIKGAAWESPRGPVSIDPETRDIIQTIYLRKVEKVDGHLYNVEFDKIENVKDPGKAPKS
jgi:branched-chain amino acid transport system substrate-binding protein